MSLRAGNDHHHPRGGCLSNLQPYNFFYSNTNKLSERCSPFIKGRIICHKKQSVTGEEICYGPQPTLIKEFSTAEHMHKQQSWHTTAAVFFENKKRCFCVMDSEANPPPICSLTSFNQNSTLLPQNNIEPWEAFERLKEFIACATARSASGSITHT